jgi:integrase
MWYCKVPKTSDKPSIWRRFPALIDDKKHGKEARVGEVMDRGKPEKYPDGRFQIRSWENGKQVYQTLNAKHGRDAYLQWENLSRKAVTAARIKAGELKTLKTIKGAAAEYVADLERERKMEAAENANHVLAEFGKICTTTFVKHITREHILDYHAALRKRKLSPRTIANRHNRVKSFLRWCKVDTKFMPDEPKYDKKTSPTIYNPEQLDALRAAADDYMRLAVDMALMLGLREQELMYACWSDVDFHEETFRVTSKPDLGFNIKDREERLLPVPAELLQRLRKRKREVPDSKLILATRNNAPNGHLLRMLKALAQRTGLNCGRCKTCLSHVPDSSDSWRVLNIRSSDPMAGQQCKEFTLHKLRRSYLTTLLRNGVDARTVQHFAGHSELATTLRYLSPATADEMKGTINAIQWGGKAKAGNRKQATRAGKRPKIGRFVAQG